MLTHIKSVLKRFPAVKSVLAERDAVKRSAAISIRTFLLADS